MEIINESSAHTSSSITKLLQMYRNEALKIDPMTAEVFGCHIIPGDPYGLFPVPGDACGDRGFFARNPGGKIAVSFDDLPQSVAETLMNKYEAGLCFTVPESVASIFTKFLK